MKKEIPSELKLALEQLQVTAFNFGVRWINDDLERARYNSLAKKASEEILRQYESGKLSAIDAATEAHKQRNFIMDLQRQRTSDIGKAYAEKLKSKGTPLQVIENEKSLKRFNKPFETLNEIQRNQIYLDIVKSAGRPQIKVNSLVGKLGIFGRGLTWASVAYIVYDTYTSNEKVKTFAYDAGISGSGFLASVAGGATAGVICGPGAPVCVTVGAFVGGVLGALGMHYTLHHLPVTRDYYADQF